MSQLDYRALAQGAERLAREAGAEIMRVYREGTEVRIKDDASPVTDADEIADRLIVAGLRALTPAIPVVSEESASAGDIPEITGTHFWLVDPLDGTKEFIARTDEFTVNIALIESGRPVVGALYVPARDACYVADGSGRAFSREKNRAPRPISARTPPAEGVVVLASRFHRGQETDDFIARQRVSQITSAGSSLKFALIAQGEADLYPRFGRTMEWDTAAGQAVLEAAGGTVERLDGTPLRYGKPDFANPHFIAHGKIAHGEFTRDKA